MNKLICLDTIGVGGQRGYVFDELGICPCQSATQWKDAIKVLIRDESNRVGILGERNRKTSE